MKQQLRMWWWTVRPGLAPELARFGACPWLTRTAGQRILRPLTYELMLARLSGCIIDAFDPFHAAVRAAIPKMVTLGQALRHAMQPAADSTATDGGL